MNTSTTVELKTSDAESPHAMHPGWPDQAVPEPPPKPRRMLPAAGAGAGRGRYQCACCTDPDPATPSGIRERRQHRRVVLAWRTRMAGQAGQD
ncbi:MAG: hypothetical protein A3F78_09295 [Burkholderiales bacterium RIFCSPLOWO2_12_FULL_61_40]|nr:MAG: hypothetical protein A3F78_09295 [Burkholderiales bacterium RIFCSPLOWO2_12_FULL_61_40]